MLYVIYGNDREKVRTRFRVLRDEIEKRCGEHRTLVEGEVANNTFDEAVSSQGLFGEQTLFVLDSILDKKAEQELFSSRVADLVSSSNYFLVLENTLDKGTIAAIKDSGAVVEEYSIKKADTRPDFNIFSLGDALGKRNKKDLWVLYQEALVAGLEPEEICGTLFWAVKNIALMKTAKAGDSAGLSPFVAQKARVFAKNYSQEEIVNLSCSLSGAYHEAHRGGEPMEISLERFILAL